MRRNWSIQQIINALPLFVILLAQGCMSLTSPQETDTPLASPLASVVTELPSATQASVSEVEPGTSTPGAASVVTSNPDFWMDLPIVPTSISQKALDIYNLGLTMGNDPRAFSKVGDCNSVNPYFLADFDLGAYNLGDYSNLQATIDYFNGSFGRTSLAAKKGLSTAGVLASLWADWKQCGGNETPLDCEYRNHRPSFAIISLGTNEAYDVKQDKTPFEERLRRIIEHTIDQGIVPILSTKADNDEGDDYINSTTAHLAVEYQLPLWNFWRAMQPLPEHGMRSSDHLTFASTSSFTDFSKPEYLDYGMQIRNLTALEVLDVVRRVVAQDQTQTHTAPTLQPTPVTSTTPEPGETTVSAIDGMTLAYIPAAQFEMGSNSGNPDQSPLHTVSLDGYWMDSTEITNTMFAKFMNEKGNQSEGGVTWLDLHNPSVLVSQLDSIYEPLQGWENHPIVGVSWYGAKAYCENAGRELPSEAQWEYAASGANGSRFPWGDSGLDCRKSRYFGCGNKSVAVGSLSLGANPFGIFELAGNVSEWVNDRYAADYYLESPSQNPTGPVNGYYRVVRGGFWGSSYIELEASHRDWAGADVRNNYIGFRCVLNP